LSARSLFQSFALPVYLRDGAYRRRLAVELVGEPVDRHDPVCLEQQKRQHRPLPRATEANRPFLRRRFDRAENPKYELQEMTVPRARGR
jgi:hypothetical protein